MPTVPSERSELNQAASAVERTLSNIEEVQGALADNDTTTARQALQEANRTIQSALLLLREMGAVLPGLPGKAPVPLHLLDTPNTRMLLEALQVTRQAAADVDRERGWTQDGEPCGYVESVDDLLLPIQREVEGPKGRE